MPQAALPFQRTINDAARPGLLKSPGISGHPNAGALPLLEAAATQERRL
jgi:hypothetical protein